MKALVNSLIATGLVLALASPSLAGDRYRARDNHDIDRREYRSDNHKRHYRAHRYERRYHNRHYHGRKYRSPQRSFYYHRHYTHRHSHRDYHYDRDYYKWLGGAILLNQLLHYHNGRTCYERH